MKRSMLAGVAAVAAGTMLAILLPTPKAAVPIAYAAAVDYYLKLEGVEGESTDERHKGEIDIESFSWGVVTPRDSASGLPTGKRQHKPISFTKTLDKSSPILMQSAFEGNHYPSAVVIGVDEDGFEFMRMSFFDVFVGDFSIAGSTGDRPMESLSLNFTKITFDYTPKGADGKAGTPVHGGWDLKKNVKA